MNRQTRHPPQVHHLGEERKARQCRRSPDDALHAVDAHRGNNGVRGERLVPARHRSDHARVRADVNVGNPPGVQVHRKRDAVEIGSAIGGGAGM